MSRVNPYVPLGVRMKMYFKASLWAVPVSLILATEVKDMYFRATWEVVPVPPSQYETGDIIAVANRWYTLPTAADMLRCLMVKTLLRCSWDDIGVIVVRDGVPYIVIPDSEKVIDMPLDQFVVERQPRGVAWRKLEVEPGFQKPTRDIAEVFIAAVKSIVPSPWYVFTASRRTRAEVKLYAFDTEFCEKKAEYRAACRALQGAQNNRQSDTFTISAQKNAVKSRKALESMEQRLKEMDVMRRHLAAHVEPDVSITHEFRLFNGSLVASFLATFGLLDRELPCVSRYVPQDFTFPLPLKGATLDKPYIVYKG